MRNYWFIVFAILLLWGKEAHSQQLKLNDLEYFEAQGVNVLVYSNRYNPVFFDEKVAGIEIIHHGVRTVTGGAVRLHNTPEQWDLVPSILSRTVDKTNNSINVVLRYEDFDFNSEVRVVPSGKGFLMQVYLENAVPEKLIGRAGLNMEFQPSIYWNKNYMADGKPLIFPRYPASNVYMRPMNEKIQQIYDHITFDDRGHQEFPEPLPIATAKTFVLAPESATNRLTIKSDNELMFFDGRILAQNGWYVVRSLLPAGKTGKVLEWYVEPNAIPDWIREPNIGFSQVGYTPGQEKVSVIELDKHDKPLASASLIQVNPNGTETKKFSANVKEWGRYLRYKYVTFDFSQVKEQGLYYIQYGDTKTNAFPIQKNVYDGIWHTTLDVWLPIQMDHMTVNEGYRTWHGTPYMDDALQAPTNHKHFDGYSMGPETDSPFKPFERIPGLAVGGWYDAGDFDIQTGSHNRVVNDLVFIWETFKPKRDMTYVNQDTKYTDLHHPDGKSDLLQQIEHGTLALVAQVENIGYPVRGIIVGNLHQYHHLGDAASITDNLPYNPKLKPYESDGVSSGTMDDRWVFTGRNMQTDLSTAASLAGASRALKEFNPDLSRRALNCALKIWNENEGKPEPTTRRGFGFSLKLNVSMQLWLTTGEAKFKKIFEEELWKALDASNTINTNIGGNATSYHTITSGLMVAPYMDQAFRDKLKTYVKQYLVNSDEVTAVSPYGVPMGGRGWAGNTPITQWAGTNYMIYKQYPDLIGVEKVLKGINYVFGCHPYSNISFVAAVGGKSKQMTYGMNRADFTFIAGGVVPGLMFLQPDFYENKDDWPFIWGENEAIITDATPFIFLGLAVEELVKEINK